MTDDSAKNDRQGLCTLHALNGIIFPSSENAAWNQHMNEAWTRDQLLVAFNLYCKIPFSKTKANNPLVAEVAKLIGRSPASVAMKLGNFGSFDPALRAQGIKGLTSVSSADRDIWDEFNQSWENLSIESELATERLIAGWRMTPSDSTKGKRSSEFYACKLQDLIARPSEKVAEVKVRLHQKFFREAVLASYGSSCCVCSNPVPQLLTAGHIIPWANGADLRANPRNGLCLCSLHHDAFDCGLWTIEDSYEIRLSTELMGYLPNFTIESGFTNYSKTKIRMPDKFWPEKAFLAFHRTNLFLK